MSVRNEVRPSAQGPEATVAEVDQVGTRLAEVKRRIGDVIFGQREVIDETLITLLAGGQIGRAHV